MRLFNKVAIIGVGLVGGSIGLALRKKRLSGSVAGVCRHKNSVILAKKRGAIDRGYPGIPEAVKDADLVILATPVSKIIGLAKQIAPSLKEGVIVTDVGSSKRLVVESLQKIFSKKGFFVGAHPLAGSEKRGVREARGEIFKDAVCIVTKTKRTNLVAMNKICRLWRLLGARVIVMTPEKHDRLVARVSHLPHMVAAALVSSVDKEKIAFGAGGLRDTTRIASGDPLIWRDIFLTNREEILGAGRKFKKGFEKLIAAIERNEERSLMSFLKKAKEKRDLLGK